MKPYSKVKHLLGKKEIQLPCSVGKLIEIFLLIGSVPMYLNIIPTKTDPIAVSVLLIGLLSAIGSLGYDFLAFVSRFNISTSRSKP